MEYESSHACLKHFATRGLSAAVAEAVDLAGALGLRADATELPDIGNVLFRMPEIRPDWPWVERLAPYALGDRTPLTDPRQRVSNNERELLAYLPEARLRRGSAQPGLAPTMILSAVRQTLAERQHPPPMT